MQTEERVIVGLVLFAGFLWLRRRAKRLDDASRAQALVRTLLFLAPALIGAKWLFDRLPFDRWSNLAVQAAGLAALLVAAGLAFMRPGAGEDTVRDDG